LIFDEAALVWRSKEGAQASHSTLQKPFTNIRDFAARIEEALRPRESNM
jgi:hypothetical protein